MLKIYAQFWTRAFDYSGRSDTTDFWVPFVFNCILVLILSILGALAFGNDITNHQQVAQWIGAGLGLIFLIPTLALETRRLRDSGLPLALLGLEVARFVGAFLGIGYLNLALTVIILVAMTRPTKEA